LGGAVAFSGCAERPAAPAETEAAQSLSPSYVGDAERGRVAFVNLGCVTCHSVNGVGGKAAQPFDAEIGGAPIDPLEFSARIWAGAPAMIALQNAELGYAVSLTAENLADLAAFASSREKQKEMDAAALPDAVRDSFLDQRFWEVDDAADLEPQHPGDPLVRPEGGGDEEAPPED
jgi:mono/diheme cytochrome c family protein